MPDYGLKNNKLEIISGSIFLYPSSSGTIKQNAISASVPQILAVTCSSNLNNRLVPPNNTSSFSIISFSTGSNQQRLILRYLSGSYDVNGKIKSVTPVKYLKKTTGTRDKYVDIPILNNDDSLAVAYKTVNSLSKTGGFNNYFSASLVSLGNDDPTTTGVGSIEIEHDFIVGRYPGGTGLNHFSSSLGVNQTIGSTFRIRAGNGIGDLTIGDGFVVGDYETFGTFKIFNFLSGSVGKADFSGSMVQVGGMMIGSSFKIGGSTQLFSHNVIQEGSGIQNQPYFPGNVLKGSSSLGILIDPVDKVSAMITGSNQSASLYFSASGQIGMGTTEPQSDFDIAADQFQVRSRRDSKGIKINEEGNIESFNKTTEGAATGSEFIMSYSRGGTNAITAQLVSLVLFGASSPGIRGREDNDIIQDEANHFIHERGGLATYLNEEEPEILRKILDIGEREGVLGTKSSAGDILGSVRWIASSGSFDQEFYEHRGGGEMLKIQGQVIESTDAGIRGDMLFFTSNAVENAPTEVMRIGSDGNVHVTGSLSIPGFPSVSASLASAGGGSVSGNTFATDLKIGRDADNLIDFTTDNNIVIRANGENQLTLVDGALTPTTNAIVDLGTDALEFRNGYFDGNLEADAITIGGTNINTIYVPINGSETVIETTFEAANGTVGTATTATNVTSTANNSTDETVYLTFVDGATGGQGIETDTGLTYNPASGYITASGGISASGEIITKEVSSPGGFTLDIAGDITLDADGADIILSDGGTNFGRFKRDTSDFVIKSETNDKDIIFKGVDNSSTITALTLDMSEAGSATFNNHITASGDISSSGEIYSNNIETFHGSARITNLAASNYSGPNYQGIMRHEWTRKLTETDVDRIEFNRQDIRTGIIIPYAFKITGFTMFYGVNKNGTQTIPQGALFALSQSQMDLNDNSNTGAAVEADAVCTGLGQGTKGYNSHLCTGSCDVNFPAGSSIYYRVKPTTTVDGTTMDMNYTIQWKRING